MDTFIVFHASGISFPLRTFFALQLMTVQDAVTQLEACLMAFVVLVVAVEPRLLGLPLSAPLLTEPQALSAR